MAELDKLKLYSKQYNDAILDAYTKIAAPLFDVVSKVPQQGERQLFDIVTGVEDGVEIKRTHKTVLGEGDFYNTKYSNVNAIRVANYLRDMSWATLVSDYDKIRMISDPTSIYVTAAVAHMKQAQQKIIFEGIVNTPKVVTVDTSTGSSSEVNGAAVQVVVNANLLQCLRLAKTKFDANGVLEEDRFFICSASVRNDIATDDKVGSSLFATFLGASAANGSIKNILGYNVIAYEAASDGDVWGYLVQKNAVMLGVNKDKLQPKVDVLPHKNYATQIYIPFSLGASRVNNKGVIQLRKKE